MKRAVLAAGLPALSLVLVAATAFPTFHRKSELKLSPVSPLTFIFHYEENIPITIAAGDFNGDGRPDIVVGSLWDNEYSKSQYPVEGNRLWVFPGSKSGMLKPSWVAPLSEEPSAVFVADFDNDGKPDLAVSSTQSNFFSGPGRRHLGRGENEPRRRHICPACDI